MRVRFMHNFVAEISKFENLLENFLKIAIFSKKQSLEARFESGLLLQRVDGGHFSKPMLDVRFHKKFHWATYRHSGVMLKRMEGFFCKKKKQFFYSDMHWYFKVVFLKRSNARHFCKIVCTKQKMKKGAEKKTLFFLSFSFIFFFNCFPVTNFWDIPHLYCTHFLEAISYCKRKRKKSKITKNWFCFAIP